MDTDPHIVIGRHPDLGIVAANRHDTPVIDHVLRRVGFHPVPGRRQLYALAEPERDGIRRARQAVQSLRIVRYQVAADAAFEPDIVFAPDPAPPEQPFRDATPARAEVQVGSFTHARALTADIASGRLVLHEQLRDPEGTLRAVGTYTDTGEGVLLHGEGHLRYVETPLATTDKALDAFAYVRGNGRPAPPPPAEQRVRAATAVSPARSAVRRAPSPAADASARRDLTATAALGPQQPARRSR
ncbi:MAG: hypothetical protein QOF84_5170 [Streptomyces sp.]|jgi:hypothetical protein|nr:hypothetical protein [Streptomyces sp.]